MISAIGNPVDGITGALMRDEIRAFTSRIKSWETAVHAATASNSLADARVDPATIESACLLNLAAASSPVGSCPSFCTMISTTLLLMLLRTSSKSAPRGMGYTVTYSVEQRVK